eukprot:scaffold505_cov49-Attheya_sp.AAC.4
MAESADDEVENASVKKRVRRGASKSAEPNVSHAIDAQSDLISVIKQTAGIKKDENKERSILIILAFKEMQSTSNLISVRNKQK